MNQTTRTLVVARRRYVLACRCWLRTISRPSATPGVGRFVRQSSAGVRVVAACCQQALHSRGYQSLVQPEISLVVRRKTRRSQSRGRQNFKVIAISEYDRVTARNLSDEFCRINCGVSALIFIRANRRPGKDHLHLIVPQRFFVHQQSNHGDRHLYAARTRFITAAMLHLFEAQVWPVAAASGAPATRPLSPPVDIAARLKRIWR
jgi:hypothetical protein